MAGRVLHLAAGNLYGGVETFLVTLAKSPRRLEHRFALFFEGRLARELREAGVEATEPRYYPEYAPDYYATFFEDPDGIRLEVMNFREVRRKVMYDWEARAGL